MDREELAVVKDSILAELPLVVSLNWDWTELEENLFNEKRLYTALGKEDARTVLVIYERIKKVAKLSQIAAVLVNPPKDVHRIQAQYTVREAIIDIVEQAINERLDKLNLVKTMRKELYPDSLNKSTK